MTAPTCRSTRRSASRRRSCPEPLQRGRHGARPGDEVDRRGDGCRRRFGTAFAKSQEAAYGALPTKGRVFVSVADRDKRHLIFPAKRLADLGFEVLATAGTAEVLRRNGVPSIVVRKLSDGRGPDDEPTIVDRIAPARST